MAKNALSITTSSTNVSTLPLDIWISISFYLSVEDLLVLRSTCKVVRDMISERSIWHSVCVDLLSVVEGYDSRQALPSMSAEDLRRKAIRMNRLDRKWFRDALIPRNIQREYYQDTVFRVQFLPGGEWIVVMFTDGTIHLYDTMNMTKPIAAAQDSSGNDSNHEIAISSTSHPGSLIYVTERRWNRGFTDIRVYHFDGLKPNLNLLTNIRIPEIIEPISLEYDLMAVPWMENTTGLLSVQMATLLPEEADREVIMDLGLRDEEPFNFTVTILTRQLLLLAKPAQYSIFSIPGREQLDENGEPLVIPVQPLWTYNHVVQPVRGRPFVSLPPRGPRNDHSHARVAILTGPFIYILSASKFPEECGMVPYSSQHPVRYVPSRGTMGPRHAMWTDEPPSPPFVRLRTCAYFTVSEQFDDAVQRFDHVGQHEVQFRTLQLPVQTGDVLDVSWDEISGRLCALVSRAHRGSTISRLLIVDFV